MSTTGTGIREEIPESIADTAEKIFVESISGLFLEKLPIDSSEEFTAMISITAKNSIGASEVFYYELKKWLNKNS